MKILMLIDTLDVGGAETHVELLCKELLKMEHTIIVVSSGGSIAERLGRTKIKHINLSKNEKSAKEHRSPITFLRFFDTKCAVARIITKQKPDIVHAHTRKMAFFAHNICKKHKIPLIVTAHAKFDMSFPKNILSKWGDHTICVSEDIKEHLLANGLTSFKISIVPNGVDLPEISAENTSSSTEKHFYSNSKAITNKITLNSKIPTNRAFSTPYQRLFPVDVRGESGLFEQKSTTEGTFSAPLPRCCPKFVEARGESGLFEHKIKPDSTVDAPPPHPNTLDARRDGTPFESKIATDDTFFAPFSPLYSVDAQRDTILDEPKLATEGALASPFHRPCSIAGISFATDALAHVTNVLSPTSLAIDQLLNPHLDKVFFAPCANTTTSPRQKLSQKRKIIFASRLDEDCSLAAYLLCDLAIDLAHKFDNLQIILIGGGSEYPKLSKKAQKLNNFLNRELISTVGRVENPAIFFEKGALFMGVSRAALEAMAHGLPILLLGNEGYLGLLTEQNIQRAENTNFTCRGEERSKGGEERSKGGEERSKGAEERSKGGDELAGILFAEICKYFEMTDTERENLSQLSQSIIENGHTARQMAEKTADIYKKVLLNRENLHTNGQVCKKAPLSRENLHSNAQVDENVSINRENSRTDRQVCKEEPLNRENSRSNKQINDERPVNREKLHSDIPFNKIISLKQKNLRPTSLIGKKERNKNGQKVPKIAICGYYGRQNLGDEAILAIVLQKLRETNPKAEISIINSKNMFKNAQKMAKTDVFIFGGGSLLQNSTSSASLFYYLLLISLANLLCKYKIMLSNGIGPLKTIQFKRKIAKQLTLNQEIEPNFNKNLDFLNPHFKKELARAINCFDFISVRDSYSKKFIKKLLPNRKVEIIPDPALILAQKLKDDIKNEGKNDYFVYIPCVGALKRGNVSFESLAKTFNELQKVHGIPCLIATLNPHEDLAFAKILAKNLNNCEVFSPQKPEELFSALKNSKFVISQRYHGALFAAISKNPILAISDDPKLHSLCQDLSLFPCQKPGIFNQVDEFIMLFDKMMHHTSLNHCFIKENFLKSSVISNNRIEKLFKNLNNLS